MPACRSEHGHGACSGTERGFEDAVGASPSEQKRGPILPTKGSLEPGRVRNEHGIANGSGVRACPSSPRGSLTHSMSSRALRRREVARLLSNGQGTETRCSHRVGARADATVAKLACRFRRDYRRRRPGDSLSLAEQSLFKG